MTAARQQSLTSAVAVLPTIGCLMRFGIMRSVWCASSTQTLGRRLAAEKLAERHDLKVSRETLRNWMRHAGIWVSRAERLRFQQPRHRREHVGELVQIDGSDHRWFEDRAPPCTLLVFVDDATSRLMELRFVASESTFAYFEALKAYLGRHGKPVAFYSDKHSIFRVSNEDAASGDGMTQFGRALSELNIEILCANTSQAKGRVERAHSTLQDRLVKELRLAGISTIDAANVFLPGFVAHYNARFAKAPARDKDLHRVLDPRQDLDDVLCWRAQRKVSHQLVVNYNQMKLTLKAEGMATRLCGKMIEIYDFPDGRLEVRWKGRPLPYSAFDKLQRVSHAAIVENKRLGEVLAWIKERQDRQPRYKPHSGGAKALGSEARLDEESASTGSPKPPNQFQNPPVKDGAAPIRWSPRRRLPSPDRPHVGHFNFAELGTSQLCCNRIRD